MARVPLIFVALLFSAFSFGQSTLNDSSTVVVHKDARIDLLVKKQSQINEETSRDSRRTMKGFRLIVVNTNNRDEAIAAKTKIYTYFPELKSYLSYQSPYFKLKAGNFKTREEAASYQEKLNRYFPRGVFVIPDTIEVNPEKTNEDVSKRN